MYLKRLDIQGFKSFADKISLDFTAGITSVVGPNGSGKSNISDAIRWVLGEQSAKNLRGGKMEDVIFSGTEFRKPVGFAEVSITINNSEKILPIEYSEVTITRRVYRSGESEYLINKTPCRLKDVNELFLDTGIGKDGYSIIGQGRVDEILSTKSEDRRAIFEEASGIMKYKVRKIEAEKKLESTDQNLIRVNDIINELEKQIEPLSIQATAAKKFLAYSGELRELEVSIFIENISKLKEKLIEVDELFKGVQQNIDDENNKLSITTEDNQNNTIKLRQTDETLENLKKEFYNIETEIEKHNSQMNLNIQRIKNLEENSDRIDLEKEEFSIKLNELNKELAGKDERISYLKEKHEEYAMNLKINEEKLNILLSTLSESERHIDTLKTGIMDKMDLQADKKIQISNIKAHIENIESRQENITNEILKTKIELDRENMKKEDLTENIERAKKLYNFHFEKLSILKIEQSEVLLKIEEQKKKLNQIKSDIQIKTSRQKFLQNMEKNLEGYSRSVKTVLHECENNPNFGRGIFGALAQLVNVDKKFGTAIEMTLGGAMQNVITATEEDAKKAIEFLKQAKTGRATFLPITSVKGKYLDDKIINELKNIEGFIGVASDLISYDSKFEGIILSLLGKVIIVDNIESGIKISKKFNYSFRIVTLEGDVLSTTGSMSGGSNEGKETGLLSRSAEINTISVDIQKLYEDEELFEENIIELNNMEKEISSEISQEESRTKENELIVVRDESYLKQIEENILRCNLRINMLNDEKNQFSKQVIEVDQDLSKYNIELNEIEKDLINIKELISKRQDKHKEDQKIRDELHEDITDFKISVNSALESMESVTETIDRINLDIIEFNQNLEKRETQRTTQSASIEGLALKNNEINNLINDEIKEKELKNTKITEISELKTKLECENSQTIDKLQTINKNIILLQEEYNRIEVKKAKSEAELENIQNRLWEDYELTYNNAIEMKKEIENLINAQKRIIELKNNIKQIGPVNISAIDEYSNTKQRYEFMANQHDDIELAKNKLKKAIEEMVNIMRNQFMEQFKLINENFNIVFRELFAGGKAQIFLSDEKNVLESGIEIQVMPPGKNLQNMMLLSGGERAFTAIALLFSILKLRPSPFCLLDEIEAALDEANVYRFAQYIKKHTHLTQFLVITHKKGTMESSDSLYGVTMQEHGVSKVVSMKLGEKAS